jgi:hypothetical protein
VVVVLDALGLVLVSPHRFHSPCCIGSQLDITPLPDLDKEIAGVVDRMKFYGQDLNTLMIKPFWQMMHNFMERGTGRSPAELTGEVMDESMIERWKFTNPNVYTWSFFHRMLPAYLFGDYDYAEYLSAGCRSLVDFPYGAVVRHTLDRNRSFVVD